MPLPQPVKTRQTWLQRQWKQLPPRQWVQLQKTQANLKNQKQEPVLQVRVQAQLPPEQVPLKGLVQVQQA